MKTLYKKDSKGKVRIWRIRTEGPSLIEEYGLLHGKLTVSKKDCLPKNVGRSNETSPEEQAVLEMESKIRKQLQEDYFLDIESAQNTQVLLPMLAKDYKKEFKKVVYPCYAQPKLDGMRALGDDKLISRKGVEIDTLNHILKAVSQISEVLDGELYAHGLSFQENMKLIKKYCPGMTEEVKYHVYDLVSEDPFEERYERLCSVVSPYENVIETVLTVKINNEKELMKVHADFVSQGYEGTIVRWGKEGYKINGRSSNLLKYKDFLDIACKVVDIIPMEARPDQGMVICTKTGGEFKATPKMSHEDRADLLKNKHLYIGQMAEIRYFEETDDGLPRFPICVGFRLDK